MQKQRLTDWPTDTFHVSDPDATTSIQKEAIHVSPMINRQKKTTISGFDSQDGYERLQPTHQVTYHFPLRELNP